MIFEIFIAVFSGLILSALMWLAKILWASRRPIKPIEMSVHRFVDDYWIIAFPERNPDLQALDGVRMGCGQSYNAMIDRGGVDIHQTRLRITLRSLVSSPILIKQRYIQTEKCEPLSGTKIHCENAGANSAKILVVDLDEETPTIWEAEEDDIEVKRIGKFPFFSRSRITLKDDDYETIILVGKASRYCVSWTAKLEFECKGHSGFIFIDSGGKPFRTTGIPPGGFATNLEWAWHARYRILPAENFE